MGDFEGLKDKMVGTVRFELTASCSQSRRANQTTLRPEKKTYNRQFAENKQSNSAELKLLLFKILSVCKKRIKIS